MCYSFILLVSFSYIWFISWWSLSNWVFYHSLIFSLLVNSPFLLIVSNNSFFTLSFSTFVLLSLSWRFSFSYLLQSRSCWISLLWLWITLIIPFISAIFKSLASSNFLLVSVNMSWCSTFNCWIYFLFCWSWRLNMRVWSSFSSLISFSS